MWRGHEPFFRIVANIYVLCKGKVLLNSWGHIGSFWKLLMLEFATKANAIGITEKMFYIYCDSYRMSFVWWKVKAEKEIIVKEYTSKLGFLGF